MAMGNMLPQLGSSYSASQMQRIQLGATPSAAFLQRHLSQQAQGQQHDMAAAAAAANALTMAQQQAMLGGLAGSLSQSQGYNALQQQQAHTMGMFLGNLTNAEGTAAGAQAAAAALQNAHFQVLLQQQQQQQLAQSQSKAAQLARLQLAHQQQLQQQQQAGHMIQVWGEACTYK